MSLQALAASDQANRARKSGAGGSYGPVNAAYTDLGLKPPTLAAKTFYGPTEDYVQKRKEAYAESDAINRAKREGRGGLHALKKQPFIDRGLEPPASQAKTWYAPTDEFLSRQRTLPQGGGRPPSPFAGGSGGGGVARASPFDHATPRAVPALQRSGSHLSSTPRGLGGGLLNPAGADPFRRDATPVPFPLNPLADLTPRQGGLRAMTPPPFLGMQPQRRAMTPPPRMGSGMGMGGSLSTPSWMQGPLPGAFATPSLGSAGRAFQAGGGIPIREATYGTPLFATRSTPRADPALMGHYVNQSSDRLLLQLEQVALQRGLPLPDMALKPFLQRKATSLVARCEAAAGRNDGSLAQQEAARALRMDEKVLSAAAMTEAHRFADDNEFSARAYASIFNVDLKSLNDCRRCLLNGLEQGLMTPRVP